MCFRFSIACLLLVFTTTANAASSAKKAAQNQNASFAQRLKACKTWQKEESKSKRTKAFLYEAHLHDLMLDAPYHLRARQKALRRAAKSATKLRRKTIEKAQSFETARIALFQRVKKDRAFTQKDDALIKQLKESKSVYAKLGDVWAHRQAAIAIAARLLKKAERQNDKAALSKAMGYLKKASKRLRRKRDDLVLKEQALRLYAKAFALKENPSTAALYSMRADRAFVSIKNESSTAKNAYLMSRATMRYCAKQKDKCARLEKKNFKTPTYYDFSKEKRSSGFDNLRAEDTRAMYEPLVQACLQKHKKLARHQNVELNWSVSNDGKVSRSEVWRPLRLRKSALEKCVQGAFERFRYRPYSGTLKTLGLEYSL